MMHEILVATDGSEGAGRAVDAAAEIAKATGARLSILTVGGHLQAEQMSELARAEDDLGAALDALSHQILREAAARAQRIGAPAIQSKAIWGDAAEVIIESGRRDGIDAIVVGRRGLGRLAGLVLGSVSQKVVSLAPCIVIVVP